jgi:Protein of unknown function (DUF402)
MTERRISAWPPGSQIVVRETWRGRIWTARPVTIVQDTPELLAFSMLPGTPDKHPRVRDADRVPALMPATRWRLVDLVWIGGGALYLSRPGEPYMVIGFRRDDNARLAAWYVNLQDPRHRRALGFAYRDQELDILIRPDLSDWRWKDEAGFAALQRRGRLGAAKAAWLRAVGETVIEARHAPTSLFRQGWEHWSPPPAWPVPTLPVEWDEVV